ncbi:MAG TPA: DUF1570 domain-containing protein [Planctomycetaceae bacterium]|nr:DUF1570 domain-containing protein [Planctomycetaceae bacterium]
MRKWILLGTSAAVLLFACVVRADYVIFRMPGTPVTFVLQGKAKVNADKSVSFTHPVLKEKLTFPAQGTDVVEAPDAKDAFQKKLKDAKTAADSFKVAQWALKRGMLTEFYRATEKTIELDDQHRAALAVKDLRTKISKEVPESAEQLDEFKQLVGNDAMKVANSKHFVMLYDTSDKPQSIGGRKKRRHEVQLELLEDVYETFLMMFSSQNVELQIPEERLKVVLFAQKNDFDSFAQRIQTNLDLAGGFWDPVSNVSAFYDAGSDPHEKAIKEIVDSLKKSADDAKKKKGGGQTGNRGAGGGGGPPNLMNLVRDVKTIELLQQIHQENAAVEIVSHEATHQMAGNTGLFPRNVLVPAWVHEGLATYFESPGDAGWSGIGAVNERRLNWYRAYEDDRAHSNINFIVGNQVFDLAQSDGAQLYAYAQSWALTHFLLETRLEKTVNFYRRLGELPPDEVLSSDVLNALFDDVFQEDRASLDKAWREHMASLKPEFEAAKGGKN